MTDSRLSQRLSIIVCLLILLKTEGVSVEITYVNNAVAKGAVCLDGSPPAYHFDKGFGEGINNWLIQIEGGAWCKDIKSCLSRKNTASGSSKKMKKQMGFSGILSRQQKSNPDFYNWNRIKVRYCDGSSFTGNVEVVDPATNLHFRGARVWLAVIEDLLAKGMKNAQNAMVDCVYPCNPFDLVGNGDWFYERRIVHMVDCVYPCNPTCHKIVSDSLLDGDEDEELEVEID